MPGRDIVFQIGIFPKILTDYIGTDGKKEQQVRRKDLIIFDQTC
jgi:hypothetical protein